jgi:adenylylsulfate kinase
MKNFSGGVIWITGLSGAGKTTLAKEISAILKDQTPAVVMLDGDELREIFGADQVGKINHTRESRLALSMRYSYLCKMLSSQGLTVVIATISLFSQVHEWNRMNFNNYFEVYLKVPIEELRRRDPKGIYSRYYSGEICNVAGLDFSIDEPEYPDFISTYQSSGESKMLSIEILNKLKEKFLK